jgi:integrase
MKRAGDGSLTFEGGDIRAADERRKTFERLVYPKLGKRPIHEITRSDINDLLDKIEDSSGGPMASHTLACLRRVFNWHAARVDRFHPPVVRGMTRGAPNKCNRAFSDDELRSFWRATLIWEKGTGHPFPRLLRFILLTAARRDEAADMVRSEIDDDVWTIPVERYKTEIDFEVPLSKAAQRILREAGSIKLGGKGFVFTTNGDTPAVFRNSRRTLMG